MVRTTHSRRSVLKTAGVAAAIAAVPGAAAEREQWTSVESPTGNTLYDVETTAADVYTVGGGGVVLERTPEGYRKVLDGGPTGNGNNLYGADVTNDGKRLWFVGSSGAIGEYDVESGVLVDHSAPMDVTNNFNDVSVTGEAGEANVYVAGDSGKMYFSYENGATGSWDYTTPGSGSAINAVDFFEDRSGHIVDGNQSVFYTRDGASWDRLGIADANVNLYGVDSDGFDDVWVSGGGGIVYHWTGSRWIKADTGDAGLRDIEVTDADADGYTVGGGGAVYGYDGSEWRQQATPSGANLKAVVRGDVDVAVGAGGAVLER
ncbi:hypothetical protein GJ629_11985 [Halapricum sp. CBA1109]|uniref:twin-arginine translocation signal domain-containing protein n=1 Tax=Halapricum sp. CBA1109 TaxID=2668068 RepID=UPI0012F83F18|nr:twin-arginine translocation signal domain-containing protein [Halapricum sp. CBA1109]MUV90530.1 hypothetical protein [Halapricum sp. CBA1109]